MNTPKIFPLLAVPFLCCPLVAQNAPIKAGAGNDTLTITAPVSMTGRLGDKGGAVILGTAAQPAKISHPQLEVSAPRINVASDKNHPIKNVAATGGVQFKVSLAQKNAPAVRIEAKCDNATLDRGDKTRTLTLNGGVDGWFQSGNGPRNQLRGQSVKITSQPDSANALVADIKGDAQGVRVDVPPLGKAAPDAKPITITAQNAQLRQSQNGLDADVDGGTLGVRLEIPPMPKNNAGGALNLGAVVVTSQRASVRQAEGQARFTGNARAASNSEGAIKFDVAADELTLNRSANGEIAAIKTTGRAKMKLDLPPDANDKPAAADKAAEDKVAFGKPNYLEVEANAATADLAKNSLVFEGDVKGFYRLPVSDPQADVAPKDYKFSGERAVISYAPEAGDIARGLNVEVTGNTQQQAQFELPAFRFEGF